ncbi:MAG: D-hexose-6-phosphate mutarotase [Gammaproteobacteria bacterium]|nr:MAG: D-hexose-6-phosphate mutarotase [Gammaproteobacteria bacterium]
MHTTEAISSELQNLLDSSDFLTLTSNDEAFPGSKGTGLPIISVKTPTCSALIALQGAHLLNFKTITGEPLLWVSPNCDFTPGVALRGGVPVCLPWFGPNADPKKPKHGFARNRDWRLTAATCLSNGMAELVFDFVSSANELFEFDFTAQLVMTLGTSIRLEIKISNTDTIPFDCSWVLHSYHPVSSLTDVRVTGLAGKTYLDNLENHAAKTQDGDVNFPAEVDRVYPGVENDIEVSGDPRIHISHYNCPSVVVWNPGATNAAKIADIGAGNEQGYICVERGAVLGEKWNLNAGETRSAWVEISEK